MKVFKSSTLRVRDANGEFKSFPALRGESSYEIAVANGYEGTQEEWLDMMTDENGWVTRYQELENKKANKEDVYDLAEADELFEDAKYYQEPWKIDSNIGPICVNKEAIHLSATDYQAGDRDRSITIKMINSGVVYLRFIVPNSKYSTYRTVTHVNIWQTGKDTEIWAEAIPSNTDVVKVVRLEVSKGDTIRIEAVINNYMGNYTGATLLEDICLCANIETPYKYIDLIGASPETFEDLM